MTYNVTIHILVFKNIILIDQVLNFNTLLNKE